MNIELFAINTGGDKIYTDEEKRNQKVLMQRRFPNPTPYEIVEEQPNPLENNNKTEEIKKEEDNPIDNGKIIQNNDEVNKILDEQKSLIQITQRQSLIIKLSNCLIVIMIILIIILFYLNYNEKYKNKNSYKYAELSDSESNNNNKKKSEIIDF